MTISVQNVNKQQSQMKKARAFALAEIPAGVLGGAVLGYKVAKPWVKGEQVSDKFVKEAMNLFGKDLPKTVPAPSTIFDHLNKDQIKELFGGCFKDLKKGTVKPKEELKGLETHLGGIVEESIKSMKKNAAIKWGAIGGGTAILSAILTMKMLKGVEEKSSIDAK